MRFSNYMGMHNGIHAQYHGEVTAECERAYMTTDAFRVLLRSIGSGSRRGRIANEDGVQLYGWRVIENDGSLSAIITDIVESSHQSNRTSSTFDVDYAYAIHRDRYLRDLRNQKNFNLLGYIHSHPGHMTYFSQTDVQTMAEYTHSDMAVMLSGLVTLNNGKFELTMYAVTQNGSTVDIWHLPLTISDREVARRMPASAPKPFEQVWCEASDTQVPPDFTMVDIEMDGEAAEEVRHPDVPAGPDAPKQPQAPEREETIPSPDVPKSQTQPGPMAEPEKRAEEGQGWMPSAVEDGGHEEPVSSGRVIDVQEAQEGDQGFLFGRMQDGKLQTQLLLMPTGSGVPVIKHTRIRGCTTPCVQPFGVSFEFICMANYESENAYPDDSPAFGTMPIRSITEGVSFGCVFPEGE